MRAITPLTAAAATEFALTALVNELAQAERGLTIVLDDYHLAESREVGEGLAFLGSSQRRV